MIRTAAVKKLLPAGLVTGIMVLALLLPAGPLAGVFAGYGYGYGGVLSSGPAVDAVFQENVFVQGQDAAVWYQTVTPDVSNSGWVSLGGRMRSDPGAAEVGGNPWVFIRGQDDGLWYRSKTTGFLSQGGVLNEGVGADVGAVAGQIKVFVRGQDNAVYYKTFTPPSTWSANWTRLGGVIVNKPNAVSDAVGSELLVVRGQDNAAYIMKGNGAAFIGTYTRLGGVFVTGISASSCSAGHFDLWGVGQDKQIWSTGSSNGGVTWAAWHPWGGVWSSDVTSQCRPGTTTVDLWGRGQDFALWSWKATGT